MTTYRFEELCVLMEGEDGKPVHGGLFDGECELVTHDGIEVVIDEISIRDVKTGELEDVPQLAKKDGKVIPNSAFHLIERALYTERGDELNDVFFNTNPEFRQPTDADEWGTYDARAL